MSIDSHAGLADIKALESSICEIDQGKLSYRGFDINDLAEHSSIEEVSYLLLNDALPSPHEFKDFLAALKAEYSLPREIVEHITHVPREANPMAILRTLVSSLGLHDPEHDDHSIPARYRRGLRLLAKIPLIVAAIARHHDARSIVASNPDLGIAANFLHCLYGEEPDRETAHLLDTTLILYAEHELNASAFAARISAATRADTYSCLVAAISTLQGDLHGGANQRSLEMLLTMGTVTRVDEYLLPRLKAKEIIMGFGHRVYKNGDPRVSVLRKMCTSLAEKKNEMELIRVALRTEEIMLKEKGLYANVDFYSGLAFYLLGLSAKLFTCVFALARTPGYLAHIAEQRNANKLIRPRSVYVGKSNRKYTSISSR